MHIICNAQEQTFTLIPETRDERGWRHSIVTSAGPDRILIFHGRTSGGALCFSARGIYIELCGTTRSDWENIEKIFDICRVSKGATHALTVVGQGREGQEAAIVVTGVRCAGCNKYVIDYESCQKRRCERCRAKVLVSAN